jgi:signal transduction histidine kinase
MVLIVDDEPGILVALEYQLQRSYEVVTCDHPEEALQKLREVDVAAVISDQRMPGMTGSALLSEAARLRPDAARILLTGYADLAAVVEAVNSGQIYYYLTKPWRPAELDAVLGRGIERWRLVREREHLLERLRQSNADLQEFAYAMAHDLTQPLRAINGFAALLAEELSGSLTGEVARLLGRIRSGSSRMAVLTDGLLRMARVAGQRPRLESLDLAALAREVVDRLRAADPDRAVEVVVPASLPARADRELIALALGALLENAWKFTGPVAGARIELAVEPGEGEATFVVRDNGVGFDEAFAHKLFGPFQRLHPESEFPGEGIGLALVSGAIRSHGGRVRASGAPGKGAEFRFTLPDVPRE